ncbi:MAG: methionine--tRNA ligase [Methanomassiliicoccales archaeon]|nr:methionine--tRNA ligase [Methanomassiliicoccales archaeon]NYT14876.1 methionine--tRNA ligase [Methanomassiliicoccales archaeon]
MAKYVVCTAWPYSNGVIHVGHVAGSLLPPDIFTKFLRIKGNDVLMVSGSDMHGTPVTVRAEKEGLSPDEVAERYHRMNLKAIEDLGITYSLFTKTHTENHFEVVHDIFLKLLEKGHLYKKQTMQYYCSDCDKFLPDRYVEGVCPKCNTKARGDQCEECGETFEPGDLQEPVCIHCGTMPDLRETEHYFFQLSAFQDRLIEWVSDKTWWKPNVQTFTQNWLEDGLEDRAITRDMSWGVSVPLEGWEDKVIYVWFEAVIGYFSACKEWSKLIGQPDKWKEYWKDTEVKHYYFLGKDNIPFHTIIWPAILMGYGGLNLAYDVPANEFLTFKGDKFSKSRGLNIDIPSILENFDADVVRYYLSANMPENRDADFSWEDFETRTNNELVATLGNYYHRVLSFTHKHFGEIPPFKGTDEERKKVMEEIISYRDEMDENLSACSFKKGLKAVMDLAQFGNRYFDSVAPWALIKEDKERCGTVLNLNLEIVKALAVMSYPFLPSSSERLWSFLGFEESVMEMGWDMIATPINDGQSLMIPKPLFAKVMIEREDMVFKDFEKLDLRVGKIKSSSNHPEAEKLLVLEVDIGEDITLVAGLKGYYELEDLVGKKIVVVSNLKPAKLRGIRSQGMLLAADQGDDVVLLTPAGDAKPGERVNSGMSSSSKRLDFQEFQKLTLRIGTASEGKADVGKDVSLKAPNDLAMPKKVALFMPSPDANSALALYTEGRVAITIDRDIGSGAKVR